MNHLIIAFSFNLVIATSLVAGVDFNKEIRPILSDKCFQCHGPDAKNQKSDYRLDTQEHSRAMIEEVAGITPGSPEKSRVHLRIHATDQDEVMPPPDLGRPLSPREINLLDQWIKEGAAYDEHWAFKLLVRPKVPAVPSDWSDRVRNPIDSFVFARLDADKLRPAAEADPETLFRRATLLATGMQPSAAAVRAFLADGKPGAYERAVDAMLGSLDHAERQALLWLDAARYADTDGYQNDNERSNWPWRDWVIQAFHQNMPFDQFSIEQLAGDMLPNATPTQVLASAFNRNHRQNAEGGALAAEFFVENVIDRVETTSTVWLGLTMNCARCHNHKYDPLSQREFYAMFAFFNNTGESGTGEGRGADPILRSNSPYRQPPPEFLARVEAAKSALKKAEDSAGSRLQGWMERMRANLDKSPEVWRSVETSAAVDKKADLVREDDGSFRSSGANPGNVTYTVTLQPGEQKVTALRLDALPHSSFGKPRQLARSSNGNFVLTDLSIRARDDQREPFDVAIREAKATFEQDGYAVKQAIDDNPGSGWAVFGKDVKPEPVSAMFILTETLELIGNGTITVTLRHQFGNGDHNIGRFRLLVSDSEAPGLTPNSGLPPEVALALRAEPGKSTKAQNKLLREHYSTVDSTISKARQELQSAENEIKKLGLSDVPVMVMREKAGEAKPSYLLHRGQYDQPEKSEPIARAVPAAIFKGKPDQQPKNRLELAQWLFTDRNPLTARVVVNRVWQDCFGIGLVKTSEDFGSQGENPAHAELLDWLAVEFMQSGWDLRKLHRLVLTSTTFRQQSVSTAALRERDPENRLLARGPRFRVDGFSVRDIALQASGLLDRTVGGPPVKPYQPDGLWTSMNQNPGFRYVQSEGADLYRKTMYTYWKRAVNPPGPTIFDATGRETCNVRARRTNTPLQALALMNDVTYLEAARVLAQKTLLVPKATDDQRLGQIHLCVTGCQVSENRLPILRENLAYFRKHFAGKPEDAKALLAQGETPAVDSLAPAELAAWTEVAHLLLNLDQTITVE